MAAFPPDLAPVTTDIPVREGWVVRVRALSTMDAARAGVLKELMGSMLASESQKARGGKVEALDGKTLERAAAAVNRILCDAVEAGSLDGGAFEDLRLVPTRAQHDPEATPPRIWVERIPGFSRGAIVSAALLHHAEAEGILSPFRGGQDDTPATAPGGEDLRADPIGGPDATT